MDNLRASPVTQKRPWARFTLQAATLAILNSHSLAATAESARGLWPGILNDSEGSISLRPTLGGLRLTAVKRLVAFGRFDPCVGLPPTMDLPTCWTDDGQLDAG